MSGACPAAVERANQHRAWIAKTYTRLSVAEQARARGLSEAHVRTLRAELKQAGILSLHKRARCRRWSAAEWAGVVARIRSGDTCVDAGHAYGRSADSVELEVIRRGQTVAGLRAGWVWAANTLAHALGVDTSVITRWLRTGVLTQAPGGTVARIPRAAVERVLSDRMYWPFVNPEQIRDPHLRAYARCERIQAAGAWQSAKVYAAERGYTQEGMRRRLQYGKEAVTAARIGHEWFVWRENL